MIPYHSYDDFYDSHSVISYLYSIWLRNHVIVCQKLLLSLHGGYATCPEVTHLCTTVTPLVLELFVPEAGKIFVFGFVVAALHTKGFFSLGISFIQTKVRLNIYPFLVDLKTPNQTNFRLVFQINREMVTIQSDFGLI